MCYYNGQKVTHAEFIRLKQLEKALAKYDFEVALEILAGIKSGIKRI